MSIPNAGTSGSGNVSNPPTDQMGQMFPAGGGNDEWRTETYRNKVRQQIDEQLRDVGQTNTNSDKAVEWENQVFNRSRTRDEYIKLVATLILKLRETRFRHLNKKIIKKYLRFAPCRLIVFYLYFLF